MATTDGYGQGISIAALTDAPSAQALAFAIVDALTQRSVMRFASSTARTASLTSPVEGMTTWLQDVNRLEIYTGSAWLTLSIGTTTWTTLTLASGFTHDGNSNGTVQYRLINLAGQDMVQLRGGLNVTYSGTNIANGGTFSNSALAAAYRPSSLRSMTAASSVVASDVTSLKIDAMTSGHLEVVGTQSGRIPPWVSLNGLMYSL